MSGLRILHLLSQTELTGAEVYAQTVVREQSAAGHQVFVVSDQIHVELPVPWVSLPISVNRWSVRSSNTRSVLELVEKHQIDVIHAHSRASVRIANLVCRRSSRKVAQVSTIHGRQHDSLGKRFFDSYGQRKILVCENLIPQMRDAFKVDEASLKVLRNPFDVGSWLRAPRSQRSQTWAFVGRSSGPKGKALVELFESGLWNFLSQNPNLKFEIICSHPENFGRSFLDKIQAWKNPGQVQIKAHVKNLKAEYENFDLVLGAGRVAVEALLSGCAVLSFGEYTSYGIVELTNLQKNLESNFGDMGTQSAVPSFDFPMILSELGEFVHNQKLEQQSLVQTEICKNYDTKVILPEILETYREAIFKAQVPAGIPILMYHKVPDIELNSPHRIFVTKKNFEKHLAFFKKSGFQSLSFSELTEFWTGQKSYAHFPKKPLLLTFDDGYLDNLTNALPLLKKYNFKAVIYLLSRTDFKENTWDTQNGDESSPLMNAQQRLELAASGHFEIGAHGVDHLRFTELTEAESFQQMEQSKCDLELEFSRKILSLAYPFGSTSKALAKLARRAGFEFAVNTDQGGIHLSDNRWFLFRVNIFPEDGLFQIWKKSSTWYRRYFFFKKHR